MSCHDPSISMHVCARWSHGFWDNAHPSRPWGLCLFRHHHRGYLWEDMDGGVYVAQCRLEGQLHGHLALGSERGWKVMVCVTVYIPLHPRVSGCITCSYYIFWVVTVFQRRFGEGYKACDNHEELWFVLCWPTDLYSWHVKHRQALYYVMFCCRSHCGAKWRLLCPRPPS